MTTYYDFLGVSPLASQDEINQALDRKYDYWRRLVTHHEQETVEEATKALRVLEQARATLTNPGKRSAYDAGLGLGPQLGGLTDPTAAASVPPSGPARTPPSAPAPSGGQRVDAWVCVRCQTPNPIGTRHCKHCGNAIGIDCPNCGRLTEANSRYCSNCGANVQDAFRKKREAEEEQRKSREAQEAERLRRQREQERQVAEQRSQEQVRQKQTSRRSCIIGIVAVVGFFMCCFGAYYIWPLMSRNNALGIPTLSIQQPTTDPLLASLAPQYTGSKIAVTADLSSVSSDQFQVRYKVSNTSQNILTLAFLSSDIVVTDNLGNTFPEQWGTQPIRDELEASGYSSEREYSLSLGGTLDPSATTLQLAFPALTDGEPAFQLTIPLVSIEQAQASFDAQLTYPDGDSFDLNTTITNNSPYFFVLRFNSANVAVTDDLGNSYQLEEYYANKTFADGLESVENYSHSRDYSFRFHPGLEPAATSLQVQVTVMGKTFSSQIPLSVSDDKVRYEAMVDYVNEYSNEFTIRVNVFNLGDSDFILRTDGNQASIGQRGQAFSPQPDRNGRVGYSISPGSSTSFYVYVDGALADQNDLILTLPVVSGTENIQIPVAAGN